MAENRRESDRALPDPTLRLLSLTEEERISLRDALHVALAGWNRRAGDEVRWRNILARLAAPNV